MDIQVSAKTLINELTRQNSDLVLQIAMIRALIAGSEQQQQSDHGE